MTAVPAEQIATFQAHGATIIPGVLSPADLDVLSAGADDLIARFAKPGFESADYWSYLDEGRGAHTLYRVHNLEKQQWSGRALLLDDWLATTAAAFIDAPAVPTAYALVLKEPRHGAEIPWHRDRTDVAAGTICNLTLCLDDWAPDCGALEWVPGSQLLPDDADVAAVRAGASTETGKVAAGDLMVHDVRLVHGSAHNTSPTWRRNIVIEFSPSWSASGDAHSHVRPSSRAR